MSQVWENDVRGIVPNVPATSCHRAGKAKKTVMGFGGESVGRAAAPLACLGTPGKTSHRRFPKWCQRCPLAEADRESPDPSLDLKERDAKGLLKVMQL